MKRLRARASNEDAWRIQYHYAFCKHDDARAIQWLQYLADRGDAAAQETLSYIPPDAPERILRRKDDPSGGSPPKVAR